MMNLHFLLNFGYPYFETNCGSRYFTAFKIVLNVLPDIIDVITKVKMDLSNSIEFILIIQCINLIDHFFLLCLILGTRHQFLIDIKLTLENNLTIRKFTFSLCLSNQSLPILLLNRVIKLSSPTTESDQSEDDRLYWNR
jgi:hypothetical protein